MLLHSLLALSVGLGGGNQSQPSHLRIAPHGYYRNTQLFGLHWSGWGQSSATATGTFSFQFCVEESCSVSPFFVDPAVVVLDRIGRCRGRLLYTRLRLHVEGQLPDASFGAFHTSIGRCHGRASRRRG
jgi:hypothetical protein